MKPAPFEYIAAVSVEHAIAALGEHGDEASIIAGGQSLLPMMALRLARPGVLVDIGRVPELRVVAANGTLEIGAAVTQATLGTDDAVGAGCPLLARVVPLIAHVAIRNRGTIGGSLAHADPAAELPAVSLLCDAELVVQGPNGSRSITAADFFVSYLTTAMAPGELLTRVRFPMLPERTGTAFREVSRRHGDFALVGAGARVTLDDDGRPSGGRLVFIGVGGTPVAVDIAGGRDLADAGREAAAGLTPSDDVHATAAYRRHVAGGLAVQVLEEAAAAARGDR